MAGLTYNIISRWTDSLQARGRFSFALSECRENNKDLSHAAIKLALNRLAEKQKVISVFKGYYLILPPQYASRGILPPYLFLDALMKHLNRSYYVSLLTAAVFHGSSHQQPQEFFVMTNFPVLRPTHKKGLTINYISIKSIPDKLLEKKKTEAGYLNVSSAVLTACDLVQYERRAGGINRVATVLNQLVEKLNSSDFTSDLLSHCQTTTLQRLGYLLEFICMRNDLADALFGAVQKENLEFYRIPLAAARETKGSGSGNRWKIIVNTKIEMDE